MHAPHILHHLLTHACDWMHTARRKALAVSVLAAVTGRRLTVTALGRSIASKAQEKHCIKRADRLLSNRHLHAERVRVYTALGRWRIGSTSRPVMIIDWSDRDPSQTHFLLRASLPLRGRAFTVYEEVHTAKTKKNRRLIRRFWSAYSGCCRKAVNRSSSRMRACVRRGFDRWRPMAGIGLVASDSGIQSSVRSMVAGWHVRRSPRRPHALPKRWGPSGSLHPIRLPVSECWTKRHPKGGGRPIGWGPGAGQSQ